MMRRWIVVVLASLLVTAVSFAAEPAANLTARRASATRIEARAARRPEPTPWNLTLGAAFDDNSQSGDTSNIPFVLTYAPGVQTWSYQLSGDGLVRNTPPHGQASEGLADFKLDILRKFDEAWSGQVGISLPSHQPQGSNWGGERVKVAYKLATEAPNAWIGAASGTGRHLDTQSGGKSRFALVAYGASGYQFDKRHKDLLTVTWSHQGGVPTTTDFGWEHDFALPGGIDATFTLVHAFNSSSRHTGVEFDLSHDF